MYFDTFCTIGNGNEYSTNQTQNVSLQRNYVSTLPGKTKNNTKQEIRSVEHGICPIAEFTSPWLNSAAILAIRP